MSLSLLLHVVIPFAFSTAALGQSLPQECTNAAMAFSQNSACFGSQPTSVFASSSPSTLFSGPFILLSNSSLQQEATSFFNSFCASQACVQLYAEALQVCLKSVNQQVNFANIKHVHMQVQMWNDLHAYKV